MLIQLGGNVFRSTQGIFSFLAKLTKVLCTMSQGNTNFSCFVMLIMFTKSKTINLSFFFETQFLVSQGLYKNKLEVEEYREKTQHQSMISKSTYF